MSRPLLFILLSLALPLATHAQQRWADTAAWYTSHLADDTARVDVFYVVSTEVLAAADGGWRSTLTPTDRAYMKAEMAYIDQTIFAGDSLEGDSFNFYAPYYHQFVFASLHLPADSVDSLRRVVCAEVVEAFRYYLDHWNRGRRFILMGFSQGAMYLTDLLASLTPEEYSRFVAAYLMGYRLSADDLSRPRIRAAQGPRDVGVCVSFNSVFDTAAVWPLVSEGAATCINPFNWRTDETVAVDLFDGAPIMVHVDKLHNVLVVDANPKSFHEWMVANPYLGEVGVSSDCLHHWDILFYNAALRQNVRVRSQR